MASPLKSIGNFLFGGEAGGGGMNPALMIPQQPPAQPPPLQSPTGSPETNKPKQGASFVSSAAPPPQNVATKSLLGQ